MDEIFPSGSERIATRFSSSFLLSLKMSTSFLVPSPKWMKKIKRMNLVSHPTILQEYTYTQVNTTNGIWTFSGVQNPIWELAPQVCDGHLNLVWNLSLWKWPLCCKDSLHHHHHLLLFLGKQWNMKCGLWIWKSSSTKKSGSSSKFLLMESLEESWKFWVVTHLLFWFLDWWSLCPREKERRDTGLIVIAALFTHQSWRFSSPHLQHQLWIFFGRQQHLLSSSPPPTIWVVCFHFVGPLSSCNNP